MTETLNLKVELKEQSEQLKEQMEDMEESINEFKSIEIEMKNKLEKLNSLLTYIKSEITQQEKGLNELSIRDVTHTLGMLDDNKMDSVKEDVKNNQELDQEYRSCETQDESEIKDDETSCDNYHPMNVDETSDEVSRGIPRLSEDELRELDVELIESKINELSYYVEETNVDIGVLEEYARRLAEFKRRKLDLNNAVQKRDEVKEQLGILKKEKI